MEKRDKIHWWILCIVSHVMAIGFTILAVMQPGEWLLPACANWYVAGSISSTFRKNLMICEIVVKLEDIERQLRNPRKG